MPQQYRAEDLNDPNTGDPISASQTRLQNELLRRSMSLPNSTSDSMGDRMVVRVPPRAIRMIEITHIDHTELGFEMKNFGFCLGKYVDFDTDQDWNKKYDETILEYDPDDDVVTEPRERYIFIGFIDQCNAGVPGQRYIGIPYGTKTATGLTGGDLTLPLVMVNGGTLCTCVLAETHPGCGVEFDVWPIPIWDPADKWSLTEEIWDLDGCDGTFKMKAVDLRTGVPEPAKYASGLFAPRVCTTHGVRLEVVTLDCESPGGCYFCEAPA